jgi:hypothetical protein
MSVPGLVGGISVERIIGDQSVAYCRTKVGAWTFGAACKNKYRKEKEK